MHKLLLLMLGLSTLDYGFGSSLRRSSSRNVSAYNIEPHIAEDEKYGARKSFNNFKRFEVRKRTEEEDDDENAADADTTSARSSNLFENIIFSLGPKYDKEQNTFDYVNRARPDVMDKVETFVRSLGNALMQSNSPLMRANDVLRPEVIQLKSGKPSLKFEFDPKAIVKKIETVITSRDFRKYAEQAAQKAAFLYKAFSEGMEKTKKNQI